MVHVIVMRARIRIRRKSPKIYITIQVPRSLFYRIHLGRGTHAALLVLLRLFRGLFSQVQMGARTQKSILAALHILITAYLSWGMICQNALTP